MRTFICLVLMAALIGPLVGCQGPARTVNTANLLDEMTDLSRLAEYPDPAYTTKQSASYDRKSTTPDDHDTWFANYDRGQYIRVERNGDRREVVLLDVDGPGAVVRIWSANPEGTLRIYLDNAEEPTIEAPMGDFLNGKVAGFPGPINHVASRGWNSYFPIAYAEHCKVTSDGGDFYYHVNYRTYDPGTKVETFTMEDLETQKSRIQLAATRLSHPRVGGGPSKERETHSFGTQINPGETYLAGEFTGPLALAELVATVAAVDEVEALRQTVLLMEFDGERTVEVPLGEFFGTYPGFADYASLPLGVTEENELWSHWFMPFHDTARVMLRNLSPKPVQVRGWISTLPHDWTRDSMHFHAGWRSSFDVPTRPFIDWNYLEAEGKGVFTGVAFTINNPNKVWWGEGDEKIYVDGETFPSHFGTGTEDYYGYAWGSPERFVHAYHNQPHCDGPGSYGHTLLNRWHIIDNIPFEESFRFDMELWHWSTDITVDMSVTAYWYARPGATDSFAPLTKEDLRVVRAAEYVPMRVAGAIEGEEMEIISSRRRRGAADHRRLQQRYAPLLARREEAGRRTGPRVRGARGGSLPCAGPLREGERLRHRADVIQWHPDGEPAGLLSYTRRSHLRDRPGHLRP
jgi:hypothetical protein